MSDDVLDADAATEIAEEYAETECVGAFGDVVDVTERETTWLVEFRTHTLSDTYTHRVQITRAAGNVISHDRSV